MATRKKNDWYKTQRSFFNRAKKTTAMLKENKAKWGVPDGIITKADTFIGQIEPLIEKDSLVINSEDRSRLINYIKDGRRFFLTIVRNWAFGQYALQVISAIEVRELGFTLPGDTGGFHERLGIVTVSAHIMIRVISTDHVMVHVERGDIDTHESKASAWPHGAHGVIIGSKLVLSAENTWQYRFSSTLRTDLHMPPEWRGKDVIFKAAYVAHANDNIEDIYFSSEQYLTLPRTLDEIRKMANSQQ